MPRNGSGSYSLPAGNPVVAGTTIEASWANTTLSDIATELTNSLSRSGAGGMTGPLRLADGSASVPALAWGSETTTGLYRYASNDIRFVIATNVIQRWTTSGTTITGEIRAEAAATQDAVVLAGRAGGSSSYAVTLRPTTLTGNRTLTLPDESGTLLHSGTPVTVAQGGTGATTAADARTNLGVTATGQDTTYAYRANNLSDLASASTARTNLGLGSMATQSASNVAITGGSISGITDLAIADGGTGASTAADARTNLGVTATGQDTTYAYRANNLSDLASASTARTNLGLGSAATMTGPSGTIVGTSDTQTLTNKTVTNLVFDGDYTEDVFTITDGASVDLDPSNGTIQLWTLGANRSPTATGFAAGQSMTLMIDDGSAYAITWPSVTWKTDSGSAPTLNTTGYTVVQLWKVSTTLYGARVGNN